MWWMSVADCNEETACARGTEIVRCMPLCILEAVEVLLEAVLKVLEVVFL